MQPRVISLHSYYLTSLVTSHFCRFGAFLSSLKPTSQHDFYCHLFLFSEKLFCVEVFPGKGFTVVGLSFCKWFCSLLIPYILNLLRFHNLFASGILSPEDLSNGLLTMLFAFLLFCRNFHLLDLPVSYMIIGLTSLCLYNITGFLLFQDGILYKVHSLFLYKIQKSIQHEHSILTTALLPCYDICVGGLSASYFYWQKLTVSSCNGGKTVVN